MPIHPGDTVVPKRIAAIQGHFDSHREHLGHALMDAYAQGVAKVGHYDDAKRERWLAKMRTERRSAVSNECDGRDFYARIMSARRRAANHALIKHESPRV